MRRRQQQSGQILVIVAVWLVALIGSAALILLTGSVEWQRNQVQQLADQAALDAAQKIAIGCSAGSASTVITEADNFVATQRARTGSLVIGAGTCAAGYTGTDAFTGSLSETIHYPYRTNQQLIEVILTVSLPISFGSYMGASNTNVTRRAVARQLSGSTNAVTANTLSCTGGQFNVGGSILASNAVAVGGGCAVYAHDRFDAASSTYSGLGNVSVYANAQTWVGGGGVCVAGANAGSSNAVCADGYERNGHGSIACGTSGTSAFLAAGDAAQNANPCAAGKAPQYVPPLSTRLPPEPNADPAAIATLPGGAACTAAGAYSTPVVAGVTVGTAEAGTPVPVKDANGYWHFKPSCYSYLDFTSMRSGIAARQTGVELQGARHFVTPVLPAVSMAGTLLVVTLTADPNWKSTAAPSANWKLAASTLEASSARVEIWYYPNNPGGIQNSETWTVLPASSNVAAQMTEWSGVDTISPSPLDVANATNVSVATTTAINTAAGPTTKANDLVITNEGYAVAAGAFTAGVGWNPLVNDPPNDMSSEYRTDLSIGVPSETVKTAVATTWALAIAAFKPAAGGGGVLDPGFYYFNGFGFVGGGGGICLNGAQVLARDVTMEFVNRAGFSTGTCVAGGGVGCAAGNCAFGSIPCSISACPPNTAADAAGGGYTWFAAPCNQAPAGDASCPGSAWCPTGDRACWNLLVWAPPTVTGQVALKGASARLWLLGSLFWPGTCTDTVNGSSTIDGTVYCGTLTVSAAAGAGIAIGSDYGISTALVEAVLLE
jgi:hypothetical protein